MWQFCSIVRKNDLIETEEEEPTPTVYRKEKKNRKKNRKCCAVYVYNRESEGIVTVGWLFGIPVTYVLL